MTPSECPDFEIELNEKLIGVEVTKYYSDYTKKGSKTQQKISEWKKFAENLKAKLCALESDFINKYDKEHNYDMSRYFRIWSRVITTIYLTCFLVFFFVRIELFDIYIISIVKHIDKVIQWCTKIKFISSIIYVLAWIYTIGCIIAAISSMLFQSARMLKFFKLKKG